MKNMKELILLFTGSYKDNERIPEIKEVVKEYLGKRMMADECPDSPVLRLSMELDAADVATICKIINSFDGNNISVLYIRAATDEEKSLLSNLVVELKPVV